MRSWYQIVDQYRREAADLCSAHATAGIAGQKITPELALEYGFSYQARELAAEAWIAVDGATLELDGPNDPYRDLEAEALLRVDGWYPRPGWSP